MFNHVVRSWLFAARLGLPSVGRAPWPAAPERWADPLADDQGATALALLTAVRRWRSEQKLSPGVPLAEATLEVGSALAPHVAAVESDVKAALRVGVLAVRLDPALAPDAVRLLSARAVAAGPAGLAGPAERA